MLDLLETLVTQTPGPREMDALLCVTRVAFGSMIYELKDALKPQPKPLRLLPPWLRVHLR